MDVRVGKPQEPPHTNEGVWTMETSAAIIKFNGGTTEDFSGSESESEDNPSPHKTKPVENQKDTAQSSDSNNVCENGFNEPETPSQNRNDERLEDQLNNACSEKISVAEKRQLENDWDIPNSLETGIGTGKSGSFSRERFNPFDRDMHMEEHHYDTQAEEGTNKGCTKPVVDESFSDDSFFSDPEEQPTENLVTNAELGLAEDHFSRPEGTFGMSTVEELEVAITNCKEMILQAEDRSDRMKNLVHKLIQLRIKLIEAKEGPVEEEEDVKVVVGHRFKKRESSGSKHYCEKCASVIWGVLHTWYKCTACGFCCHDKCLNLIYRTCAYVKVKENTNCILSICPQKGLDSQNYRCAECSTPISFISGQEEPRRCDYTGAFYCRRCHWNDVMVLPARVVHNWDLEPRKVCRASKQFLRLMAGRACLRIQDINPMLFSLVEELNDVKKLREEILIMKRYFLSCQDALSSKLLLQLKDRQHFVENSDTYSLQDLMDVSVDLLLPQLAKIHSSFAQHIKTDCQEENYTEYRQLLRMDEDTYQFLLGKIRHKIAKQDTTWRKAIPADQRLSVTLRYLATGHFQTDIKRDYRVSQPRVGVILRDTCEAIIDCLHEEYFETPKEPEDWQKIANLFWQRWNFPHCLGGLDGKHIKVRTPINSGSLYFNYKGQFSIVLMALVDANYLFRWIDVGAEGRVADGGVWRKCALKKAIDNDTAGLPLPSALPGTDLQAPYVIVGDDAFAIDEHLLKPFSRRGLSDREAVFNYRLSRARRVTENAFGILANRFGCLLNKMVLNPDAATAVVMACCLLHNMLRQRCGRNYIPEGAVDSEDSQHYFIPGEWRRNNELPSIYPAVGRKPNNIGRRSRETLADFFQTTTGRVSWQQRAIDE